MIVPGLYLDLRETYANNSIVLLVHSPTIGLTVSAANVIAQQDASAPTRLALEVTFYPGRSPAYETVPGPDSKPSGDELRLFGIEPFEVIGGYVPTLPSDQQIQIKAAVFDDGTYEGDAETAAAVRRYQTGEKMELLRLILLLENALNSSRFPIVGNEVCRNKYCSTHLIFQKLSVHV